MADYNFNDKWINFVFSTAQQAQASQENKEPHQKRQKQQRQQTLFKTQHQEKFK